MEETAKIFTVALAKDIAKVLLLNAAATVGVFGGMIAVGAVIGKVQEIKDKKSKTITA